MRISDWSSDVCSSDLKRVDAAALAAGWRDFAGRVAAQFPRLDAMGIAYRVAPPGARIADGMLEANSVFPGTAIEYRRGGSVRSEEHTSELQSLMRISYAGFCLKKKNKQ